MPRLNRRTFLSAGAASVATLAVGAAPPRPAGKGKPVVVSSANGLPAVEKAMELIRQGMDPLDAAIAGVGIVEADPKDNSVGYGGLPNEEGVVELDAAVMHGPTHGAGSVASLRNIIHPAAVARLVMKRTKHCLLVGPGALKFARAHGFPETELLTEDSRKIWLRWRETHSANDDWIPAPENEVEPEVLEALKTRVHGTIHCSALDTHGDLGCVTTTSGLSWKIPGRVGDSPIFGAGLFLDNAVGSAGSTGVGEINLMNCSSFLIVENIRRGMHVQDAIVAALKQIITNAVRNPRFRDENGKPNFDLKFYGLSKSGEFAGGSVRPGAKMAVHVGESARLVDCATVGG
ncbi:MAG: N(4)-(beta-N-acetylglucosaminyl)-L-asparaginase [Isosphaeraceae bacterium]